MEEHLYGHLVEHLELGLLQLGGEVWWIWTLGLDSSLHLLCIEQCTTVSCQRVARAHARSGLTPSLALCPVG